MKKTLHLILFIATLSSIGILPIMYITRDRVEQNVFEDEYPTVLCGERNCVSTIVWHNGEIIHSRFDAVKTITDSIMKARKLEGERILNALGN